MSCPCHCPIYCGHTYFQYGSDPSAYNYQNNEFYEKPRKKFSCEKGANTMLMPYQKKIRPILAMTMLGLLTLLIAACSSVSATGIAPSSVNNSISSTLNDIQTSTAGLQLNSTGYTLLNWDPFTHNLTVSLNMAGLTPHSTHPAH